MVLDGHSRRYACCLPCHGTAHHLAGRRMGYFVSCDTAPCYKEIFHAEWNEKKTPIGQLKSTSR